MFQTKFVDHDGMFYVMY